MEIQSDNIGNYQSLKHRPGVVRRPKPSGELGKPIFKNIQAWTCFSFFQCLSEVILQYLPLKDKLRLECLSKQFQRTVFQKQNVLVLVVDYGEYQPNYIYRFEQNVLRLKYSPEYQVVLGMDPQLEVIAFESCYHKPIESLLKKCPNIQSIDLTQFHSNNNQISKLMIQMITKYCNHLIEFKGMSINTNECESQEFCRKFGQKLKYFGSAEHVFDLNLFPNIESVDEYSIVRMAQIEEVLQLNPLNHLKKLNISYWFEQGTFVCHK